MEIQREVFEFGRFRLDVRECSLFLELTPVPLEPQVFNTLRVLVENAGHLVEKQRLLDEVWGEAQVEEGNLARNISVLRKALGEGSNGEKFIETIPKRGYRFIATLNDSKSGQTDTPQDDSVGLTSPSKVLTLPRTWAAYIATAVIGGLVLVASIYLASPRTKPNAAPGPSSVAVLPFKLNINTEGDQGLEFGMAEAIINKLRNVPQLAVRPLGVVRRYVGEDRDPLAVGREIGVDTVLESTLSESADGTSVTSRLLRVRDGETLWSFRPDERQSDLLALQIHLSEKVAASLAATLTSEQKELLGRQHTSNAEAYRLYLKGRFFFDKVTPDGVRKSVDYYQQAIDKDPKFALAYTGLCASYTLFGHLRVLPPREVIPAAKAALARALELENSLSEAHSQAGFIALHYDYDWALADKEFLRAIELDPSSPSAHNGRAFYLSAIGKSEEALEEIRIALDLEPVSLHLNSDAGLLLFNARHHNEAIDQLRRTLEMGSGFPLATRYLARVYAYNKMESLAAEQYRNLTALIGSNKTDGAQIARAIAESGLRGYYRFELERLKKKLKSQYVPALDFARIYSVMGDRENAIKWIGKAIEERHFAVPFLNVDPDFDGLRSDPRFVAMLEGIGLKR